MAFGKIEKGDSGIGAAFLEKFISRSLLHALLGKTSALGSALTSLELRVRFADHVGRAFAGNHLAISVTALGGGE